MGGLKSGFSVGHRTLTKCKLPQTFSLSSPFTPTFQFSSEVVFRIIYIVFSTVSQKS